MLILTIASLNGCSSGYLPPDTRESNDNWLEFIDSPVYGNADCQSLDPDLGSPEAAVVKFLSSRVRGDDKYLLATIPEADWDGTLNRKMAAWKDWKVTTFQLRRKRYEGESRILIEIYMGVDFKGEVEQGTDSFELVRVKDKWMVYYPPT